MDFRKYRDLRIGSIVELSKAECLMYVGTDLSIELPTGTLSVGALSLEQLNNGVKVVHAYCGEDNQFMFMFTFKDGQELDSYFFQRVDQIRPTRKLDWANWLEPGEGIIGLELLTSPSGMSYERTGGSSEKWLKPNRWVEELVTKSTMNMIPHDYNMFSREICPGQFEYVIVDHVSENDPYIGLWIGISTEHMNIKTY